MTINDEMKLIELMERVTALEARIEATWNVLDDRTMALEEKISLTETEFNMVKHRVEYIYEWANQHISETVEFPLILSDD